MEKICIHRQCIKTKESFLYEKLRYAYTEGESRDLSYLQRTATSHNKL